MHKPHYHYSDFPSFFLFFLFTRGTSLDNFKHCPYLKLMVAMKIPLFLKSPYPRHLDCRMHLHLRMCDCSLNWRWQNLANLVVDQGLQPSNSGHPNRARGTKLNLQNVPFFEILHFTHLECTSNEVLFKGEKVQFILHSDYIYILNIIPCHNKVYIGNNQFVSM